MRSDDPVDVSEEFGPVAHRYDEVFTAAAGLRSINARELSVISRRLGDVQGRRILDAGMGTGRVARALADRGAEVVGVDVTREMLDQCRTRAPEASPVVARVGPSLPFADASFDDAVCVRVLKYFSGWLPAFEELRRVLRPGGRIVIEMANARSLARWGYRGRPVSFATVDETLGLLRQAGFLPLALDPGTRLPYAFYRRSDEGATKLLEGAERAAGRVLGGAVLARSFFVTAELGA